MVVKTEPGTAPAAIPLPELPDVPPAEPVKLEPITSSPEDDSEPPVKKSCLSSLLGDICVVKVERAEPKPMLQIAQEEVNR